MVRVTLRVKFKIEPKFIKILGILFKIILFIFLNLTKVMVRFKVSV